VGFTEKTHNGQTVQLGRVGSGGNRNWLDGWSGVGVLSFDVGDPLAQLSSIVPVLTAGVHLLL